MRRIIVLLTLFSMFGTAMFNGGRMQRASGIPQVNATLFVDPPVLTASVGETVSIDVSIANVVDLVSYELKLEYDNTILEATGAYMPDGHFMTPIMPGHFFVIDVSIHQDQGFVYFGGALLGDEPPKTGSGYLGTIVFLVINEGQTDLTFYETTFVDVELLPIPLDLQGGHFTTSHADQIVIDKVIVPENLTTDLIALRWPQPLHKGDILTPLVSGGGQKQAFSQGDEHTVNGTKWFYWINDDPFAMFGHKTRYVLIDSETGEPDVTVENWPPALNGKELWPTPEKYWNETDWVYSTCTNHSQTSSTSLQGLLKRISSNTNAMRNQATTHDRRVLIIEGSDFMGSLRNASEICYGLMTSFGYSNQEIIYLAPESRNKVDGLSTKENVLATIQTLSNALDSEDELTLFSFTHGFLETNDTGYVTLANWEKLHDYELNQSLGQMRQGVHINIIMESCHAGVFMDDLWPLKNVETMMTSTDCKSECYSAILDPPLNYKFVADLKADPNVWDEGGEFSSGLFEGLEDLRAQFMNGSISVGELYVRAYNMAKALDAGYLNGDRLSSAKKDPAKKPTPLMNTIYFEGDINHDGKVNILDATKAAIAYNSAPGYTRWDPEADVDKNRWINIVDITKIAIRFGWEYFK